MHFAPEIRAVFSSDVHSIFKADSNKIKVKTYRQSPAGMTILIQLVPKNNIFNMDPNKLTLICS